MSGATRLRSLDAVSLMPDQSLTGPLLVELTLPAPRWLLVNQRRGVATGRHSALSCVVLEVGMSTMAIVRLKILRPSC